MRKSVLLSLGVLVSVGSLLRLWRLGQESLWVDEAWSVSAARLAWPEFWTTLRSGEVNMGLYYLLLRLWMTLGQSEQVVRLLSVLFSIASILALYVLVARMFGPGAGLASAMLLSVNTFHIAYAQEARSYSLLVLLAIVSSTLFLKWLAQPSRVNWIGYTLATAMAVYSHFFGAMMLAVHWVSLAVARPSRRLCRGLAASSLAVGIAVLPLIVLAWKHASRVQWIRPPGLRTLYVLFYSLAGNRSLLLAYALSCLLALVVARRSWRRSPPALLSPGWSYLFLLAWLVVPLLLSLAVSLVQPILVTRYLIISLPPLLALAAIGVAGMRPAWARVAALSVILTLSLPAVAGYYRLPQKDDWRSATRYILAQAKPGDALLFFTLGAKFAVDYYSEREGRTLRGPKIAFQTMTEFQVDPRTRARMLARVTARYPRVWLVGRTGQYDDPAIPALLGRAYPYMVEQWFHGVRIQLYTTQPIAGPRRARGGAPPRSPAQGPSGIAWERLRAGEGPRPRGTCSRCSA